MRSRGISVNSFWKRHDTRSSDSWPVPSARALACAMANSPSSIADRKSILSVTLPSTTRRYGVSRKPYSLVRA
jgi:hypothetical protein